MCYKIIFALLLVSLSLFEQPKASSTSSFPSFGSPLLVPLHLISTFGDFRPNHFHSGIDLSTNGSIGLPVLAIADGYVSRIKIASGGYGNALYFTHSNGFVSVYGHLSHFNTAVDEWLIDLQYKRKVFELDVLLEPGKLSFKKGAVIAYTGNTGYSGGPHLHFEIRDEKTEHTVNPLLFGLPVEDKSPPAIKTIYFFSYRKDKEGVAQTKELAHYPVVKVQGRFVLKAPVLELPERFIIGIECNDLVGSGKKQGVYSVKLLQNNFLIFESNFSRFPFEETSSIKSYLNYSLLKKGKNVAWSYREPGNTVSLYGLVKNRGIIEAGRGTQFEYQIADAAGNTSSLHFAILPPAKVSTSIASPLPVARGLLIPFDKKTDVYLDKKGMSSDSAVCEIALHFPARSLFDTLRVNVRKSTAGWIVGDAQCAVRDSFLMSIKTVDRNLLSKGVICPSGKTSLLTFHKDNRLYSWLKEFGAIELKVDTLPPVLRFLPLTHQNKNTTLSVFIRDEGSGIAHFEGSIDGKWALFRFDAKHDELWYEDKQGLTGIHEVTVFASDRVGNSQQLTKSIKF